MIVDREFMQLRGTDVYTQFVGPQLGGHAMVVMGYSDVKQAFKVFNSWGTAWGDHGFGWINYTVFRQLAREGYVAQDIFAPPPTPQPTPPSPVPLPTPQPTPPSPVRLPTPVQPSVHMGSPFVLLNQSVMGPPGAGNVPGMLVSVPETLEHGIGHTLMIGFIFTYPDGRPLRANDNEHVFRDATGEVMTYLPAAPVLHDPADLTTHAAQIPNFALNFAPSNPPRQQPVAVHALAILDGHFLAQSPPTQFILTF
jgi:Papain family cysteine protease